MPLVLFGMYLLVVADGIVVVDLTMLMTNGLTRMEWHHSLVDSVFRGGNMEGIVALHAHVDGKRTFPRGMPSLNW